MHTYMYARMYMLLNVHTPKQVCTPMYACTHTFIHLHPDMKIIEIKASDLYEKSIHVI